MATKIKEKVEVDFDKFLNAWKDMEDSSGNKLTASDISAISERDKIDAIKRRYNGYDGAGTWSTSLGSTVVAPTLVSVERVEELESTIAILEARVKELERRVGKRPSGWKGKL